MNFISFVGSVSSIISLLQSWFSGKEKVMREPQIVSTKSYVNYGLKHIQRVDLNLFDDNSVFGNYVINAEYSDREEDKLVQGFKGCLKDNHLMIDFFDKRLPYQTDPEDMNSIFGIAIWRIKRCAGGKESVAVQTYGRDYEGKDVGGQEYIMELEQVESEKDPSHVY